MLEDRSAAPGVTREFDGLAPACACRAAPGIHGSNLDPATDSCASPKRCDQGVQSLASQRSALPAPT
ncbi:MAG: hypothetical protein QOJ89_499, partial [bacterium]